MRRILAWLLIPLVVTGCERDKAPPGPGAEHGLTGAAAAPVASPKPPQRSRQEPSTSAKREPELRTAGSLVYTEMITAGANEDAKLPLIVAIHGLGDRPESFAGLFFGFDKPARIALPRAPQRYGRGYSWFEYRGDGDVKAIARGIDEAAKLVAVAIGEIARTRPTSGKPVITGFSQGGMMSFAVAVKYPRQVSAAFPMGGWLPPPLWPSQRASAEQPRIVALHGEADRRVPLGPTRQSVEALKRKGYPVELHTFPGVRHAVPPALRAELFEQLSRALDQQ